MCMHGGWRETAKRRPFAEDPSATERLDIMSDTALFIHVPVDEVEILSLGISASELFYFMGSPKLETLETRFQGRTLASSTIFQRKLTITRIENWWAPRNWRKEEIDFRGVCCGQQVTGTLRSANKRRTKLIGEFILART